MATVAEQLRTARAAAGLSIKQAAEATKIRGDHLLALEEGNYDAFVAPVYIRGFVRTYARLLHLDQGTVFAALDAELSQTTRFREHPALGKGDKGALDALMLLVSRIPWRIVLPVLGLLAVLFIALSVHRVLDARRARDPVSDIAPGLYEAPTRAGGETLAVPTNTTAAPARR